jgi:hypothetical protein
MPHLDAAPPVSATTEDRPQRCLAGRQDISSHITNSLSTQPDRCRSRRRRISPDTWATLLGAIRRQHDALPATSPRRRPSLAHLKFMEGTE